MYYTVSLKGSFGIAPVHRILCLQNMGRGSVEPYAITRQMLLLGTAFAALEHRIWGDKANLGHLVIRYAIGLYKRTPSK